MGNVVRLAWDKNAVERRRSKDRRREMSRAGKMAGSALGRIDGYAVVAWDGSGRWVAEYDAGSNLVAAVPGLAQSALQRAVQGHDD